MESRRRITGRNVTRLFAAWCKAALDHVSTTRLLWSDTPGGPFDQWPLMPLRSLLAAFVLSFLLECQWVRPIPNAPSRLIALQFAYSTSGGCGIAASISGWSTLAIAAEPAYYAHPVCLFPLIGELQCNSGIGYMTAIRRSSAHCLGHLPLAAKTGYLPAISPDGIFWTGNCPNMPFGQRLCQRLHPWNAPHQWPKHLKAICR